MRAAAIALAAFAVSASPATAGEPVFDVHVHLREGETSLRQYEADAAASGLAVSGLASMWFGGPNHARPGRAGDIRAENDRAIALAARHGRMLPVVTVHPYDGPEAVAEIERTASLGAKIMKIHPHTQGFDAADPRVAALVRRAGELGLIVLMDNANIVPGDSEKLFNLAIGAPKTRFIFAHVGGLNFRFWNILGLARTAQGVMAENMWFDLSAISVLMADSPLEQEFIWTLRNIGVERLLLGSDYPQFSLAATLQALERLDLSSEEKAKIRYENARRLFGLRESPLDEASSSR